jgi:hypothetical protein
VQTEFIPVSANTQDLQWHRSPAQQWFLALVHRTMDQGLSTRSGSKLSGENFDGAHTRLDLNRQMCQTNDPQGMYILGADGMSYGFTNDHEPGDIQRFMNAGLTRFKASPPKRVTVTEAEKRAAFSITPTPATQVLQVFARIPTVPQGCSFLNEGVGRDFCWVYREELVAISARACRGIGAKFRLPETLARRIARFHLVDDVRGTPDMWGASEVRTLDLEAQTVVHAGHMFGARFAGPVALRSANGKRGYEGQIEGRFDVEPEGHQLGRFRMLAEGKAWGAGTYTPNPPPGKFPLSVAIVDTTDPAARIVPPEEVATYNRDTRYRRP